MAIHSFDTIAVTRLEFDDDAYDVGLSTNYEKNVDRVAISYSSMLTPPSVIEISLNDEAQRTILKPKEVSGYDKEWYGSERLHAVSRDGTTHIPISVVYTKDTMEKIENGEPVPVHLYAYGAYGDAIEASFSSSSLPLLNRGVVYVIAVSEGIHTFLCSLGRCSSGFVLFFPSMFVVVAKWAGSGTRNQMEANCYAKRIPSMIW